MTSALHVLEDSAKDTHLNAQVNAELERICASDQFRSSKRCREFLQYIVQITLNGKQDTLKERSIAMDLLGRDTSYDPSADSTVRVRANDIRKRLGNYYSSIPEESALRIVLPTGTYVPQFVPNAREPREAPLEPLPNAPSNHIWKLAAVIVFVLVLTSSCVLLWQNMHSQDRYHKFWSQILSGKRIVLMSMSDQTLNRLGTGLYPLVWVSGRFGVPTVFTSGSLTGATTANFAKARISEDVPTDLQKAARLQWLLNTRDEPTLFIHNKDGGFSKSDFNQAALLTILPESPSILYLQSTNQDALRKILEELTEREHFPKGLVPPSGGPLQVLLLLQANGHTTTQIWEPNR